MSAEQVRTVIITGAKGGIGRACAQLFARTGARLVLVDQVETTDADLAKSLIDQGAASATFYSCNVGDEAAVAQLCIGVAAEHRLDVVINVAGMMEFAAIENMTGEMWKRSFDVNFLGAAYFITQAFRLMRNGGSIVNIASIHARSTTAQVAAYAAAKAAMVSLTRSASIEGEAKGIRVNAVLPGAIDTPMLWNSPNIKSGLEKLEQRDIGQPEDVAAAVLFLASESARFITGSCLQVDGGRLARL